MACRQAAVAPATSPLPFSTSPSRHDACADQSASPASTASRYSASAPSRSPSRFSIFPRPTIAAAAHVGWRVSMTRRNMAAAAASRRIIWSHAISYMASARTSGSPLAAARSKAARGPLVAENVTQDHAQADQRLQLPGIDRLLVGGPCGLRLVPVQEVSQLHQRPDVTGVGAPPERGDRRLVSRRLVSRHRPRPRPRLPGPSRPGRPAARTARCPSRPAYRPAGAARPAHPPRSRPPPGPARPTPGPAGPRP